MTFILVPNHGEDVQINAWNWRPTLELLRNADLINSKQYERMGAQGCGGIVDDAQSFRIADFIEGKLSDMKPGERVRADLTITVKPKPVFIFSPKTKPDDIDANELYSISYEWLVTFKEFCRNSKGFEVY